MVFNQVGTLLVVNRWLIQTLGFAKEELIGQNITIMMPPKHAYAGCGHGREFGDTGLMQHGAWTPAVHVQACNHAPTSCPWKQPSVTCGIPSG